VRIRIKKELVSKVIILDGLKVLLLKRNQDLVNERSPWTWDLPGGHIDPGETAFSAAKREVTEETKIDLKFLLRMGTDSNIGKLTYFYVSDDWSGPIELSDEHEDYKWVSPNDLHNYEDEMGNMYYKMVLRALKTRK
jgi:8-oxo-dGTP pyrophosphatase MutT (NUDIX family)